MKRKILIVNSLLLVLTCFYFYHITTKETLKFTYPLDDSYIHLAIAKNSALSNNWGIDGHKFTSTTSSPLFTLTESFLITSFGLNDYYPLIINSLFGILFILLVHRVFKNENSFSYLILTILIIWMPLVYVQVLTGMEHMIHIFLILLSVLFIKKYFSERNYKTYFYLCICSIFLTLIRYESLFFILPICFILLVKRDYLRGLLLGLISLVPIFIYGLISMNNGADFLPNSLLIKGTTHLGDLLVNAGQNITGNRYIIPLIIGNLFLIFITLKKKGYRSIIDLNYLQIITLITILLHSIFAKFGWLYRYESYLLVLAVISISPIVNEISNFKKLKTRNYVFILSFGLTLIYLLYSGRRIYNSYNKMERASINIFEQQIQMGKFINQYYNNSKVVANDIGAISYYSNIDVLDLVGLGSNKIQRIRREKSLIREEVLSNKEVKEIIVNEEYEIAVIYDHWFPLIPNYFIKVGEWTIRDNVICGGDTVSFYAIGLKNKSKLKKSLIDYNRNNLDKDVEFKYY